MIVPPHSFKIMHLSHAVDYAIQFQERLISVSPCLAPGYFSLSPSTYSCWTTATPIPILHIDRLFRLDQSSIFNKQSHTATQSWTNAK